jgi:SAM-dependent methyltransferase
MFLNQETSIKISRQLRIAAQRCQGILKSQFLSELNDQTFFCPACNNYCAEWIDWSKTYQNVICPRCFAFPRHRLLSLFLKEKDWISPQKILHFAPESSIKKYIKKHKNLDYVTADLNMPFVDVKVDITNIPFPDHTFDIILCNHVLEHIIDDRQAMRELLRILKPGGWASLMVPIKSKLKETYEDESITSPKDRLKHFGQEDHVRWYGQDYEDRLKECGFQVIKKNYANELSEADFKKFGLRDNENLYIGIKPNS